MFVHRGFIWFFRSLSAPKRGRRARLPSEPEINRGLRLICSTPFSVSVPSRLFVREADGGARERESAASRNDSTSRPHKGAPVSCPSASECRLVTAAGPSKQPSSTNAQCPRPTQPSLRARSKAANTHLRDSAEDAEEKTHFSTLIPLQRSPSCPCGSAKDTWNRQLKVGSRPS